MSLQTQSDENYREGIFNEIILNYATGRSILPALLTPGHPGDT